MGFDEPALERASEAERQAHRAMIARWDCLLVPSEYFIDTFVRSYDYRGALLRCGLPRNDPLVQGISAEERTQRLHALNLPTDRKLILYAPTFRAVDEHRKPLTELIDLRSMHRELGDEFFLMVRAHYLDRLHVSRRYAAFARDLSAHHDVSDLLLLADVLVTDYSSVMFDYANLGRPMVFFAYDYDDYVRDERGTYVELTQIAPGPVVHDAQALIGALKSSDDTRDHQERYAEFKKRFCTYETGQAARTVVHEFFGGEDPHG
jgi:CDP-glycerol glycerophosphotransferase